ncbi:MAG TPA: T9SS type A sorting domain-containing protein [Bacteroidales bacterium]|nr:T9SS type A sorting domain-containing protein [Bacteroidales bacterium]
MRKSFTLLLTLLMTLGFLALSAQEREISRPVQPLQGPNSILYGTDVYLNYNASQNQRNATVCVADNGWIYAAYSYYDVSGDISYWELLRSVDDGASWTLINSASLTSGTYQSVNLELSGTNASDIIVYLARVYHDGTTSYLRVSEYDANGSFIRNLIAQTLTMPEQYLDVSIATDFKYPAFGASPFTVGVAYSHTSAVSDYIDVQISGDGGVTISDNLNVTTTGAYVRGVSIAYGRCSNYFNGRYFVTWEETDYGAPTGKIYVAHTNPYYNSAFTAGFELDNLVGSADGYCFDPIMGTQFNNTDNDAADFTAIVLLNRDYMGLGTDYDVIAMYNKDPVNTDNWIRSDIANSTDMDFEGDINFDPVYNNFLVTWCALTEQKLKYVVTNQNTPDSWLLINGGYNDAPNLAFPYPKVEINSLYQMVAHVWIGEGPGSYGQAMFDAEWSTVGIPPVANHNSDLDLKVFPNPATCTATLTFNLPEAAPVRVSLFNVSGQAVKTLPEVKMTAGLHTLSLEVSDLPAGTYNCQFSSGTNHSSVKVVVLH